MSFDHLAVAATQQNALFMARVSNAVYLNGNAQVLALSGLGLRVIAEPEKDQYNLDWFLVSGEMFEVLAFRGTDNIEDVFVDLGFGQRANPFGPGNAHEGFTRSLLAGWPEIISAVDRMHDVTLPLFVTGHSLGATHAALAVQGLAQAGHFTQPAYTFGCPRIGDDEFVNSYPCRQYRVMCSVDGVGDFIPMVPMERLWIPGEGMVGYRHVSSLYVAAKGLTQITTADDLNKLSITSSSLLSHPIDKYIEQLGWAA